MVEQRTELSRQIGIWSLRWGGQATWRYIEEECRPPVRGRRIQQLRAERASHIQRGWELMREVEALFNSAIIDEKEWLKSVYLDGLRLYSDIAGGIALLGGSDQVALSERILRANSNRRWY
jgi:hypothetical protein